MIHKNLLIVLSLLMFSASCKKNELKQDDHRKEQREPEEADPNALDKNGNTAIHRAIFHLFKRHRVEGSLEEINSLKNIENLASQKGINLNIKDRQGYTPLHLAAHFNEPKILKILLENGADPNIPFDENSQEIVGKTALAMAIRWYLSGDEFSLRNAELLLKYGADSTIIKNWGDLKHGLEIAAIFDFPNLARVLLQNGADPNQKEKLDNSPNSYGETLLDRILDHRSPELVKVLLEGGADVKNFKVSTSRYSPPLVRAFKRNSPEIVKLLLNHGADPNLIASYDKTPLHMAIEMGSPELVKLLLEHGANPCTFYLSKPPLFFAVEKDSPEEIKLQIVRLLLEKGADPNDPYLALTYPIQRAIKQNSLELVKLLLDHGAHAFVWQPPTLNALFVWQPPMNALLDAAQLKQSDIVKLLLEVFKDQDSFHDIGSTLLSSLTWIASEGPQNGENFNYPIYRISDEAKFLVDSGINIDAQEYNGRTVLWHMVAQENQTQENQTAVQWLLSKGANPNLEDRFKVSPFQRAFRSNNPSLIEIFQKYGPDVNKKILSDQKTMLHSACENNKPLIVRALLKIPGIDVNAQDSNENTPLHYAVREDNHHLVFLLKNSAGINIDAVNSLNETPLYLAAVSPKHSKLDGFSVFDRLLQAGANPLLQFQGKLLKEIIQESDLPQEVKDDRIKAIDHQILNQSLKEDPDFLAKQNEVW